MEIFHVELSKKAEKDLQKVPAHIVVKLMAWVDDVIHEGLSEARKIPGYHDEALSIRFRKAYRAIYQIDKNNIIYFAEILEVNKHEY